MTPSGNLFVTPRIDPGSGGGGGPPTGPAGGDLTGTYPDPQVDGLQGRPVSAAAPALGDVLTWDGAQWAPAPPASVAPSGPAGGDLAATAVDPVSDYPNPIVSGGTHLFTDVEFNQPGDAGINHNTPGARIYSLEQWTLGAATPVQAGFQLSVDAPDRFGISVTGPQADAGASIQMQTHTAGVIVHDWELLATGTGASQGAGKWNIRYIPLGVLGDWMTIVGATGFIGMGLVTAPAQRLDVSGNIILRGSGEYQSAADLILRCPSANVIRFADTTPLDMATLFEGGGQVRFELAAGRAALSIFADDVNQSFIARSGTGTGATFFDHQTMNLRDQAGTQRYAWSTATAMAQTTDATVVSVTIGTAPHTFNCNVTILGNTVLGDATSDTWSTVARLASNITPSADNNFDLGSTALRIQQLNARLVHARNDNTDTLKATLAATALTVTAGNSFAISARDTQIQGQFRFVREVVAPGATITYNWDLGNYKQTTLGGAANAIAFTNLRDGLVGIIELIQDASGNRTVTWPATAVFPMGNGGDPPLSTNGLSRDRFFVFSDGTNLYFLPMSFTDGTGVTTTIPINAGAGISDADGTTYLLNGLRSATETEVQGLCSRYSKARRLRVVVLANTMNDTTVVTIRKNNAASSVTVTIPAATTGVHSDFLNRAEYTEGDNWSLEVIPNGEGNITFYGSYEFAPG